MKSNYIEFKKKRELGDVLSDSFAFLRGQLKPLLITYFKIVGPYLLVLLIALGGYFYALSSIFDFVSYDIETSDEAYTIILTIVVVIVLIISGIATAVMSQSSILYFIESYIENNGTTDFTSIRKKVYQNFWSFFGLGIIIGLSVGIGMMFCIIPGIYLYVPLSLAFAIYVFSKKNVMDSYNYSFTLIKEEWWITFATIFIIGIIVGIAGAAFSMPATIYSWIKLGLSAGEYDAETSPFGLYTDPIYLILYIIGMIFRFVLNIISIVAGVLIYFNLNEKKNFTGTFERIQNLGKTPEN